MKQRISLIMFLVLILTGCGGGGDASNNTPKNVAPSVNAGNDQIVDENSEVFLVGTASDSDGTIRSVVWRQLSGTTVSLDNGNQLTTRFDAPNVDSDQILQFELEVTDNDGAISSDTLSITVNSSDDVPEIVLSTPEFIRLGSRTLVTAIVTVASGDISETNWSTLHNFTLDVDAQSPLQVFVNVPSEFSGDEITVEFVATSSGGKSSVVNKTIPVVSALKFVDYTQDYDEEPLINVEIVVEQDEASDLTPATKAIDGYDTIIFDDKSGVFFESSIGSLTLVQGTHPQIMPGDIIVGINEDGTKGYMRKILSIKGDVYTTELANLYEAFPNAQIKLNLLLTNDRAQTKTSVNNSAKAKFNSQDIDLLTFDRTLMHAFSPSIKGVMELSMNSALEVDFDISILQKKVERLVTIAKANYDTSAYLDIDFADQNSVKVVKDFIPIVDKTVKLSIGIIPLLVNVKVIPQLGASVDVESKAKLKYGYNAAGSMESGFTYSNGEVTNIRRFTPSLNRIGPEYEIDGAMNAQAEAKLQVVVSFYETTISVPFNDDIEIDGPGVAIDMGPYAQFSASAKIHNDLAEIVGCSLDFWVGLQSELQLDYGVVGDLINVANPAAIILYDQKYPLWHSSECTYEPLLISVKGSVKDEQGLPLPNSFIELKGLTDALNQTTMTNSNSEYEFKYVAVGNYEMFFSKPGYFSEIIELSAIGDNKREVNAVLIANKNGNEDNNSPLDSNGNLFKEGTAMGDPHLRTMDGLYYDFQGLGEYILTRSSIDDFEIQTRTQQWGDRQNVSLNSAIAAKIEGDRVGFYKGEEGLVVILNGEITSDLPNVSVLPGGGFLKKVGDRYELIWSDSSVLHLSRRGDFIEVRLRLNNTRIGTVDGLLGFYDGSTDVELRTSEGVPIDIQANSFNDLYDVFGESWRVNEESSLFDYFENETTETFVDRNFPGTIVTEKLLRKQLGDERYQIILELCQRYVTFPVRLNACILDVAMIGEEEGLAAYRQIALPKIEVMLTPPPEVAISSPEAGSIQSSNVLIQGSIQSDDSIVGLTLSLNGGGRENITSALDKNSFAISKSASFLNEGNNTLVIYATDINGITGNHVVSFVFDVEAAPEPGGDLIVVNDVNLFDDSHIHRADNIKFVKNLVDYSTQGIRNDAKQIIWDSSHASRCFECVGTNTLLSTWQDIGYEILEYTDSDSLLTISDQVKLVILWTPTEAYSQAEINSLKRFAAQGGRILFVGENQNYYGADGLAVENEFLMSMGALMRNIGQTVLSGNTDLTVNESNRHQLMDDVKTVRVNLVSLIELGENDYPLLTSHNGQNVIAGVARININVDSSSIVKAKKMKPKNRPSPIVFKYPGTQQIKDK